MSFAFREFTQERNFMIAATVEKPSAYIMPYFPSEKLIQEKNPVSVENVEKPSVRNHTF